MKKLLEYGGIAASIVLIAFGVGATIVGIDGRDRVRTELAREQIVGTPDSTIPNQLVAPGSEAQAFAKVMRKHALEATGGKTYSQMPRFATGVGFLILTLRVLGPSAVTERRRQGTRAVAPSH